MMESSKQLSNSNNNGAKSDVEEAAPGDATTAAAMERNHHHRHFDRQPLAPVQSSKKRKRDRPSFDGEEGSAQHNDIENKKPRLLSEDYDDSQSEVVPSSSDEETDHGLPLGSPPSIDSVLSPWDACDEAPAPPSLPPPPKHEHSTPHSARRASGTASHKKVLHAPCYVSPSAEQRPCPLPQLSWADPNGVWKALCRRDGRNLLDRHPNMLDKHPGILPKMRAILLDWLIEVCEVYKLHRETFHLAMDYLDRYLSRTRATCKTQLQLIGITCLFIAAKMEEIYPPKIAEFAYVTDGACDEADIQMQELGILQVLEWKVNTITAIAWLGIYLQVDVCQRRDLVPLPPIATSNNRRQPVELETPDKSPKGRGDGEAVELSRTEEKKKEKNAFEFPQFSGYEFTQVAQLMDLCALDVEIANHPYSVVAAAAVYHVKDRRTALAVSGLSWESIADCVQWMEPFHTVILEDGAPLQLIEQNEHVVQNHGLRSVCPNLTKDDSYKIQMHSCNLDMFDKVIRSREEALSGTVVQNLLSPEGMLTPPASSRKSLDAVAACAVSETKQT